MNILYLFDRDLDDASGVSEKICMQSNEWVHKGHDVQLLSLKSLSFFSLNGERLTDRKIDFKNGKLEVLVRLYKGSIRLKDILAPMDFDIIFMRNKLYDPFFKRAIKNKPIIVEINSDDIKETKLTSKFAYLYNIIFRNLFLNSVNGFVFVSKELQKNFLAYQKKSIILANGIDAKSFLYTLDTPTKRPSLVFIGTLAQKWQGTDKFLYLAGKLKDVDFHMIGMDGENHENVYYHGYLSPKIAMDKIKDFDIGICTLALHRKEMEEASPLKSRQYLAQGLPIIYAYDDTDITDEYPFMLKLPNTEDNIHKSVEAIKAFIDSIYKDENLRIAARKFALDHLDTSKKEDQRLLFMESIMHPFS